MTCHLLLHMLYIIHHSNTGDITRHLGHLGYKVTYHQKALDEYQYGVSNIKVDLKDGARLT